MATQETTDKVIALVNEHMAIMEGVVVTAASKFVDDLGADSLDLIELVLEAEDMFDILIPDDAELQVKTVGDFADLIEAERAKAKAR